MENQNQALVIPLHPRANAPKPQNPVEPPSLRRLLLKRKSVRQRAYGMIGLIKAIKTSHHIDVHMEFTRQFDSAFDHSLCWFHASRPMAKLIPANKQERDARDWIEKQYWNLYDDIEAYCQAPTAERKAEIERDFNHWVRTQVNYAELRYVLGQLYRAREELLLVLKYPWLPLHNNLSERQIREYVKRRKISGGTRSVLGQRCRDTFASLKKTCRLHGVSFSRFLKDRITGSGTIPKLSDLVREKSAQLWSGFAYGF